MIPPEVCGFIEPYDVSAGEFRTHYAGFFDNGFGMQEGTTAVLEVRVRDVPFRLTDGQPICRMRFSYTDHVPERLYGKGSHYADPRPSLAKFFNKRYEAWQASYWRT